MFSYCNALERFSPIKSKKFAAQFYKSRVDELIANMLKNYCPDIVLTVMNGAGC